MSYGKRLKSVWPLAVYERAETFSEVDGTARRSILWNRPTGARRFLVADEVGLGKTVVAQEVIRGLMRGRRRPLVVFYFASNLNIAHQNRRKLLEVLEDRNDRLKAAATADRLTLVPLARQPKHPRLNLYTFTPETSIPLRKARATSGRMEERALLRNLLLGRYPSLAHDLPDSMFQGRARRRWTRDADKFVPVEDIRGWQLYLLKALRAEFAWPRGVDAVEGLRAEAKSLGGRGYGRLLARLRSALAFAAIERLKPDLIIFDEFQKFRELLIDSRTRKVSTDRVTLALRGDGHPRDPGLLLLSATPYRLYSTRGEDLRDESHHREFFELIGFLFGANGSRKRPEIEEAFEKFRTEMERPELDNDGSIAARDRIQSLLRPVMSRTERPTIGEVHSGLSPKEPISSQVNAADLRVFTNFAWRLRNGKTTIQTRYSMGVGALLALNPIPVK